MPYALLIAGAILLTSGVRNTQDDLFRLLKSDFTGQRNFAFWMLSILIIGAFGYIPKLKPVSTAFLVLVVVVLFLSNRGFFAKFQQQIQPGGTSALPTTVLKIPDGLTLPTLTLPKFF